MRPTIAIAAALAVLAALGSEPTQAQVARGQARLWDSPGPCDRECLIGIADRYLAALVAHDPGAAPMAGRVRFTENTELLDVGEGLWQTATAVPMRFAIYVPDPVSRMLGFIGMMEENGAPIQLGLRLAINDDGEIVEAEHQVVRNVREGNLENLRTPRPGLLPTAIIPESERLPRELMLVIAQTYYDAIEQSDGDASLFADECERHENGMITAGGTGPGPFGEPRQGCNAQLDMRGLSYIDSIDLRRVWIADEVTGLAFGISQFRHSMEDHTIDIYDANGRLAERTVDFDPFDLPAMHIFKIRGGKIYDIEAMGFMAPYMSPSGWNPHLK
jgi:hypothetical protein